MRIYSIQIVTINALQIIINLFKNTILFANLATFLKITTLLIGYHMNNVFKLIPFIALTAAPFASNAKAPNWNYVQGSYITAESDDSEFKIEPDGFGINGSFLVNDNVFLSAGYSSLSDEIYDVDLDLNQGSVGLGYRHGISENTDVFGAVSYEYIELEADSNFGSDSVDESGYGLTVGLRSMVGDAFELNGQIGYIKIDDESETAVGVSAFYHFTEQFSVGGGYTVQDDLDTLSASVRFSF